MQHLDLEDSSNSTTIFYRYLHEMVRLQDIHNQEVHPEWMKQDYAFYRAIWTECAELLDHYGWKWWKHQTADLPQTRLEVVDIWHFGLSMIIIEQRDLNELAQLMVDFEAQKSDLSLHCCVESLALHALHGQFNIKAFTDVMNSIGMSFKELYGLYVGKNLLNRFRQANGYKDGTYKKVWQGEEDNVHLARLVREMDPFTDGFTESLYRQLDELYDLASG